MIAISLFDYSGNWLRPYREAGYEVYQIDKKLNYDVFDWPFQKIDRKDVRVILASPPCDNYALSGAWTFKAKDSDGRTEQSNRLVSYTMKLIRYFRPEYWAIENPMSRIHKLNPELGEIRLKFQPFEYAGYDPEPEKSRYKKQTWLWGKFNIPEKKPLEPLSNTSMVWKYGGKSERTKELRSITPMGFAYAFFEVNH
jgi:site-specific DNA-cytosine methylase